MQQQGNQKRNPVKIQMTKWAHFVQPNNSFRSTPFATCTLMTVACVDWTPWGAAGGGTYWGLSGAAGGGPSGDPPLATTAPDWSPFTGLPHLPQNLELSGIWVPQLWQNIGGRFGGDGPLEKK